METSISQCLRDSNYGSFDRFELVGRGQFGKVYRCIDKTSNRTFAMKKIVIQNKKLEETVEREVMNMAAIDSFHRLIQFYGSKREGNSLLIFLEYATEGSLLNYISKKGQLDEKETALFTKQVLEGVDYLHKRSIIHRDIKSGNILLDENFNVKLADFGLTKKVDQLSAIDNQTFAGTLKYMAPELLKDQNYNNKVDIWSLGVTVVEMITGKTIYPDLCAPKFIIHMSQGNDIEYTLPPNTSSELKYYLLLSFTRQAKSRPDVSDMMVTKFILNVPHDSNR